MDATGNRSMAITTCKDKRTARFLAGERVKEFQAFSDTAIETLTVVSAADKLGDLRHPPGNHFEALGGDRKGEYSVRINRKNRVCFRWAPHPSNTPDTDILQTTGDAFDVYIEIDYH
jgi:proteic killer suppression protein